MDWWQWLLVGLTIWAVLVTLICVMNYRFWNLVQPPPARPMSCTGCQRHFIVIGCPVHDPQGRQP